MFLCTNDHFIFYNLARKICNVGLPYFRLDTFICLRLCVDVLHNTYGVFYKCIIILNVWLVPKLSYEIMKLKCIFIEMNTNFPSIYRWESFNRKIENIKMMLQRPESHERNQNCFNFIKHFGNRYILFCQIMLSTIS